VAEYQGRLSGPLLDRIDLHIEVPAVTAADLILPPPSEGSREVAARDIQVERYAALGLTNVRTNAQAHGPVLEEIALGVITRLPSGTRRDRALRNYTVTTRFTIFSPRSRVRGGRAQRGMKLQDSGCQMPASSAGAGTWNRALQSRNCNANARGTRRRWCCSAAPSCRPWRLPPAGSAS
jgi:hypothetical protein